jgi:predicted nucleic acid-binding protein
VEAHSGEARALLRDAPTRQEPIVAPPLLPSEVATIIRQRRRQGQVRLDEARARLTQFLQVAGALVARLVEQLPRLGGEWAVAGGDRGAQALELRQGLEPPPLLLLRQSRSRGPIGSTQTPALPGPRRARGDQPGQVGWPHTDPPLAQAVGGQAPPVDPAARAVERARSAISRRRSVASGRRARTS